MSTEAATREAQAREADRAAEALDRRARDLLAQVRTMRPQSIPAARLRAQANALIRDASEWRRKAAAARQAVENAQ